MIPDEHTLKFNTIAEQLGLDYRMGDIVVALKWGRGTFQQQGLLSVVILQVIMRNIIKKSIRYWDFRKLKII